MKGRNDLAKKNRMNAPEEPLGEETVQPDAENAQDAAAPENGEENEQPVFTEEMIAEIVKPLQKKYDELNDKLLRTAAEYDNFRKRSQKEKEAAFGDAKADTLKKLLPVLDNFERGAASADSDPDSYRKGMEMTVKQLFDVLHTLGAEAFGEKGDPFDPNLHDAVMHAEDPDLGENVIAEVFLKGYKVGDRILRPATVKVAN